MATTVGRRIGITAVTTTTGVGITADGATGDPHGRGSCYGPHATPSHCDADPKVGLLAFEAAGSHSSLTTAEVPAHDRVQIWQRGRMNRKSDAVDRPRKVVLIPSVSGGIGHISRCAALARALRRRDPTVMIEFVLDTDRLRPFNIDAALNMGFRPRLLPSRNRDNRDAVVRACLGDADVIVDDVSRYLLPLRQVVPEAAWVSILMHPVGDELFMDWPLMAQMDALIWPYAPLIGLPPELASLAGKVVRTGPFLEITDVPSKREARIELGLPTEAAVVLYSPRGFPFGPAFGHRVLAGVYGAAEALRRTSQPMLQLVLLAVSDPDQLRGVPGLPATLPDWVQVKGVVPPQQALLHSRAADVLIGEGTSTMHEGAALRTPLVLVPGPIQEATLLGQRLGQEGAARVIDHGAVTPDAFAAAFSEVLADGASLTEQLDRAQALVTGGGGVNAAAQLVLQLAGRDEAQDTRSG